MILENNQNDTLTNELVALLEVERQARQNTELELSVKTTTEIFNLLKRSGDFELLSKNLTTLCQKRGQPIKTISNLVKMGMNYMNSISEESKKMKFVEVIKDITEKKIFLEVEYARCCMLLVKYNESNGNSDNLQEAQNIMEKVQVETYGSMSKKEKLEFILYQMKLNYLLKDLTKLYIVSKKINPKHLEDEGLEYLKLTYFVYCYHIQVEKQEYGECTRSLVHVFEALEKVKSIEKDILGEIENVIRDDFGVFLIKSNLAEIILTFKCLQSFGNKKREEIIELKKKYEVFILENRQVGGLLSAFITEEISSCDLQQYSLDSFIIFRDNFRNHLVLQKQLERELIKKNLFYVSRYYKLIKMEKLTILLSNNIILIEEYLCQLILDGIVRAKINRLLRVVDFKGKEEETETLDGWVKNIDEIVDLIDFVCERIEREEVTV